MTPIYTQHGEGPTDIHQELPGIVTTRNRRSKYNHPVVVISLLPRPLASLQVNRDTTVIWNQRDQPQPERTSNGIPHAVVPGEAGQYYLSYTASGITLSKLSIVSSEARI